MPGATPSRGTGRHAIALFAGALLAFVALLAVFEQIGLPRQVLITVTVGGTLAACLGTALARRSMRIAEFETAGRSVGSFGNGLAIFAAGLSAPLFLGLGGEVLARGHDGLVFGTAIAAGALLLAVLVAPAVRRSEAATIADFLALRYGGTTLRLFAAAIAVTSAFLLLVADLAVTARLAGRAFGLDPGASLAAVSGLAVLVPILGGMRSVTPVQMAQAMVVVLAALLPLAAIGAQLYGVPVPGAGFSRAVGEIAAREQDLTAADGALFTWLQPFSGMSPTAALAILVTFAFGLAAMPHLVARPATATGVGAARTGGAFAVALFAGFGFAAAAYAVFARLALQAGLAGLPPAALAGSPLHAALERAGALDLLRICGAPSADALAVVAACSRVAGHPGSLSLADVELAPEGVFFVAATLSPAPVAIAALVLAAGLAAGLAAAQGLLAAIATTLAHDLFRRGGRDAATPGRRLVIARLALAGTGAAAFGAALAYRAAPLDTAAVAFALAAGGLFPAIALGVWWSGTTGRGAFAGMATGLLVTSASLVAARFPDLPLPVLDSRGGALLGLPAGFAVTIAASVAHRRSRRFAATLAATPVPPLPTRADRRG